MERIRSTKRNENIEIETHASYLPPTESKSLSSSLVYGFLFRACRSCICEVKSDRSDFEARDRAEGLEVDAILVIGDGPKVR